LNGLKGLICRRTYRDCVMCIWNATNKLS